jgi:Starch-binding associating with outer membrane
MKKINHKIFFGLLAAVMFVSGCSKDYLDVNTDPNRVTDDNITPELIFTQAAVTTGIRVVGGQAGSEGGKTDVQFVNNWVGYMSGTGDFALDGEESTYNIGFAFADPSWQRDYALLFSLYQVKTKALAKDNKLLAGAAMILSAKVFQEMTDAFGDIPYSQAFQSSTYSRPAYDKQQDIYAALQASLDEAVAYMHNTATIAFTNADIVNHGDTDKWIKFANTVKLRLLIRQSEVSGFNPAAEITKIQAEGGVLGAGESVGVNPGYSNSQNKQSPFYGNYGFSPTSNIVAAGIAANDYVLNILLSTQDARVERFFTAVGGNYVGCVYGLSAGNPFGPQSSYFGPGLNGSAEQDQWLIPSFESLFFKAEAIARGWMPGDTKTAFEDAIKESYVWLGVPDAIQTATEYIAATDIANFDNAGAAALDKAKFIAVQKYIALCCIDPREAWADIRRLDMLEDHGYISVNPGRLQDMLPVRLLYPQTEKMF